MEEKKYRQEYNKFLEQSKNLEDAYEMLRDAAVNYSNISDVFKESMSATSPIIGPLIALAERAKVKEFEKLLDLITQYEDAHVKLREFKSPENQAKLLNGAMFQEVTMRKYNIAIQQSQLEGNINELEKKIDPMMNSINEVIDKKQMEIDKLQEYKASQTKSTTPQDIPEGEPNGTPVPQSGYDLLDPTKPMPIASKDPDVMPEVSKTTKANNNNKIVETCSNDLTIKINDTIMSLEGKIVGFDKQLNSIELIVSDTNEVLHALSNIMLGMPSAVTVGASLAGATLGSQAHDTRAKAMVAPILVGQAHDGIDSIPREGTWLLDKGERVIDSRTNEDLKAFIAKSNDDEVVRLLTQQNSLLENTYKLIDEKPTPALDSSLTATGSMQSGVLDLNQFADLGAESATQQLRDLSSAATEADRAFITLDEGMVSTKAMFQDIDSVFKSTFNGGTAFQAIFEGGGLDALKNNLHEQLEAYAMQKTSHLLMEAAYETALGAAALLNPLAGNASGHFAAAAQYAGGAALMGTFVKLSGKAHDGMDYIPKEGTWLLDKGERVVDARTNKDLKNFMSQKGGDVNVNITIHGGNKESIMSALPDMEQAIIHAVAGNIINNGLVKRAIMDYTR
ncbi:MAG: hypothetical protein LBV04_07800 [Deferribacteraceae bacterium]|jgi:hypothetical protein|nr:hypothetical protein [Deferribacteraceae bacterium]